MRNGDYKSDNRGNRSDIFEALRDSIRSQGVLSISKMTGISRSRIHDFVTGKREMNSSNLEKIMKALNFSIQPEQKLETASNAVEKALLDGQWEIHFFNFVDDFRKNKSLSQILHEPPSENERYYSLMKSIVCDLCDELNLQTPTWARTQSALKEPWFVSGVENLKAMSILESPVYYKRNNIFVLNNFLKRA